MHTWFRSLKCTKVNSSRSIELATPNDRRQLSISPLYSATVRVFFLCACEYGCVFFMCMCSDGFNLSHQSERSDASSYRMISLRRRCLHWDEWASTLSYRAKILASIPNNTTSSSMSSSPHGGQKRQRTHRMICGQFRWSYIAPSNHFNWFSQLWYIRFCLWRSRMANLPPEIICSRMACDYRLLDRLESVAITSSHAWYDGWSSTLRNCVRRANDVLIGHPINASLSSIRRRANWLA